jgi:hypothetical protein
MRRWYRRRRRLHTHSATAVANSAPTHRSHITSKPTAIHQTAHTQPTEGERLRFTPRLPERVVSAGSCEREAEAEADALEADAAAEADALEAEAEAEHNAEPTLDGERSREPALAVNGVTAGREPALPCVAAAAADAEPRAEPDSALAPKASGGAAGGLCGGGRLIGSRQAPVHITHHTPVSDVTRPPHHSKHNIGRQTNPPIQTHTHTHTHTRSLVVSPASA